MDESNTEESESKRMYREFMEDHTPEEISASNYLSRLNLVLQAESAKYDPNIPKITSASHKEARLKYPNLPKLGESGIIMRPGDGNPLWKERFGLPDNRG